jgi:hypothetical protein
MTPCKGIFLMIQHSDGDKEWQKSQLINILRMLLKMATWTDKVLRISTIGFK